MKKLLTATAAVLLVGAPAALEAQRGPSCDLAQSRQSYSVAGGAVVYIGGPVFTCDNGTRITADSAIYVESTGRIDFIRNVRFNEPERSLTSMYAQYVGRERRLMAQQNVVLTNRKDGSVLNSPLSLDYFQVSPTNRQARIEVYSGRPTATLHRRRANSNAIDTTRVIADRMQIVGDNTFKGWGAAEITRGTLKTKSGYAEFDEGGSYIRLYTQAVVQTDTFRMSADSIDATLVNGDEFKDVRARGDTKLESEDVDVDAPRLTINFTTGKVERLIAVGGSRIGANAKQATTTSPGFTLTADSIDARTPGQKLDRVTAVGTAFGAREPDSLDAKLPDLIARDWVRGDTVKAYFGDGKNPELAGQDSVQRTRAPGDTTRVIERIIASGNPASSTYRLRERVEADSTQVSVNYITAKNIDVVLRAGVVDFVRAEGDIRGLYLQPPKRESAAADGRRPR